MSENVCKKFISWLSGAPRSRLEQQVDLCLVSATQDALNFITSLHQYVVITGGWKVSGIYYAIQIR